MKSRISRSSNYLQLVESEQSKWDRIPVGNLIEWWSDHSSEFFIKGDDGKMAFLETRKTDGSWKDMPKNMIDVQPYFVSQYSNYYVLDHGKWIEE